MGETLQLKDYHSLIDLQPKDPKLLSTGFNYNAVVRQLFDYFHRHNRSESASTTEEQRAFIRAILTIRDASVGQRYSGEIYDLIDQMLIFERCHMKSLMSATNLPVQFPLFPQIRVWRGDITTLIVDAIVNAGNANLLGCFQPTHLCIDNVIHAAAGPRLRDDCYTIMQRQGRPEPVGHAKVTLAHNLPSKYVFHTVGPQLFDSTRVTHADAQALASCYRSCLDLVEQMKTIHSIAFCCISTGLFCFPADFACQIAIKTVLDWCKQRSSQIHLPLIVFNVFSPDDERYYLNALGELSKSTP